MFLILNRFEEIYFGENCLRNWFVFLAVHNSHTNIKGHKTNFLRIKSLVEKERINADNNFPKSSLRFRRHRLHDMLKNPLTRQRPIYEPSRQSFWSQTKHAIILTFLEFLHLRLSPFRLLEGVWTSPLIRIAREISVKAEWAIKSQ